MATKKYVLGYMDTVVQRFLWDDRKDDEELPRGVIEEMVESGELTVDELVEAFRKHLAAGLGMDPK